MLNLNRLPAGIGLVDWNSELPSSNTGDPLGMTLRVGARLGAELLHCVTSVTPRARYYSFFPWAFQRAHDRTGGAADFGSVMQLVLMDERAMTLGAVLHHEGRTCDGGALQGSSRAMELVADGAKRVVDLGTWNHLRGNTSGFDPYKGSLINLGMFAELAASGEADDGEEEEEQAQATLESGRLSPKGRRLAEAFDRAVAGTTFVDLAPGSSPVGLDVLEEFGAAAGLCELRTADDFDLSPLRELFFAADVDDEANSHFRRRMSLMLLLWAVDVAGAAGLRLDARTFDDLTYYRVIHDEDGEVLPVETPQALIDISERWRIFHFHNYLTTALEALLAGLVRAVAAHQAGRTVGEILDAFDGAEAHSILGEYLSTDEPIGFLDISPSDSLALLGIKPAASLKPSEGVAEMFEADPMIERTLRSALVDEEMVSGPAGPAVAALLLFVLLARYDLAVDAAHKGWNTQKVFDPFVDVALPTVAQALVTELGGDWWTKPNREVLTRVLARFVVRQHETMSYVKGFGGSPPLFRVDGPMIVGTDLFRDEVGAGNPRFPSAMQVLRDLRLIVSDPDGGEHLTADGRTMLDSLLAGEVS